MRVAYTSLLSVLLVLGLVQAVNADTMDPVDAAMWDQWQVQQNSQLPAGTDLKVKAMGANGEGKKEYVGHITLLKRDAYPPTPNGPWELTPFYVEAAVHITDIVDPALPPVDVTLTGEATLSFTRSGTDASPFFDTEMLSMDLAGGGSTDIRIRESPTRPSTGRTSFTQSQDSAGNAVYNISDSFFDVFTELSLDGGNTYMPGNVAFHMSIVPEPSTLVLLGIGAISLLGGAWRRRQTS